MADAIDSTAWTGRYWHIRDLDDDEFGEEFGGPPAAIWRQLAEERASFERQQAFKALVMLWGPAIKSPARDRRRGWTIYDGYERARGEEWTLWRAIVATVAIVTGRRWGQRQADAADRAFARWQVARKNPRCIGGRWVEPSMPRARDSFDMGHWDASDGLGWGHGFMCLHLYPWGRVDIFSDGE